MRNFILGLFAALAVVFFVASPAAAMPIQPWDPTPTPPKTGIFIEDGVDEETRNLVQSAFEAGLDGETSLRITYAAELPETWDIQTAARKTAEAWDLDRNVDSILFYDTQGKKVFIWPATETNTAVIESLPKYVEPIDFSKAFNSLYGEALDQAEQSAVTDEIESATGVVFKIFGWVWPFMLVIFAFAMFGSLIRRY